MLDVRFILCYLSTITDNTSIFYFVGGVGGGEGKGFTSPVCIS